MKEDCYNLPLHYTRTQWNHKDVDDDESLDSIRKAEFEDKGKTAEQSETNG